MERQASVAPPRGSTTSTGTGPPLAYSPTARAFHWVMVGVLAVQVPVGLYMTYRGNDLKIWDGLTNSLYSGHKLFGIVLLLLVIARLTYRLRNGAPADEPSLEWWQKAASHVTHWSLYGLLIAIPLTGWLGVSRYPALDIFGLFKLPGLVAPDQAQAATLFFIHKVLAIVTILLIGAHVGAALFHYVVRKDGVLLRMLPGLPRRG